MPLYIDIHKVPGATANDLAQAHAADMKVQDGLGVCCVKYWFNEGSGKVFCLIEAPSVEAANEVHARSHGLLAEKIIEVDPEMIDELYKASEAGASIDLIVRSICCLRAGLPGMSENIRVRSIVGRNLEHSRILRFGAEGAENSEYIIGSADMMPRNLDRRVEAMLRVTDPRLRARLDEILAINLADDELAWTLEPDGTWRKVPPTEGLESQVRFQELALARSKTRTTEG